MQVRFDDARPGRRRGFMLDDVVGVVRAHRLAEVCDVLATVEQAVVAGHWVGGWVAYEAAEAFDPALSVAARAGTAFADLPLVWFAIARDRVRAEPALGAPDAGTTALGTWRSGMSPADHADAVRAVQRHIAAGETYQVNLTFQLATDFTGDAQDLYRQLLNAQSGAFGAHVDTGRWVVASASPELFFEWADGVVTCRPMKGTTARGIDLADDERRRAWLQASPKNRAENVMIVDMVRNDLARVAVVGGVAVPQLFTTEKYDTLWQMTSTVTGDTQPATSLVDVFEALFPSASITGAPKVATSRIITDLEAGPRGVYCGAIGFGGPGGGGPEWTFNVGIRTVTVDCSRDLAHYGTGGGITIDSDPADEYDEAVLKARVLRRQSAQLCLLETTRWDRGVGLRHRDAHLARLAASATYFDVPLDPADVEIAITQALGRAGDRDVPLRVRVLVDRSGAVEVACTPAPPLCDRAGRADDSNRVRLAVDDQPVDPATVWLHHKTTVRGIHEAARERHPEADDVVMVNRAGRVTETTIGNLAVLLDDDWTTPPAADGLLAGTERAARLATGQLVEGHVTVADLGRAGGLARLNSVRGWEPATLMA